MSLSDGTKLLNEFKKLVNAGDYGGAEEKLMKLKELMLELDSLPPLCLETPSAQQERDMAREVFEYAALLSIGLEDKDSFQRYISSLRPYYTTMKSEDASEVTHSIVGLSLLFLLVENRLADFHCELEMLTEKERQHPAITFCTQLDKHLVVGSYDQVLVAAAHPPIHQYAYFLKSLLETVRINIADCIAAAYDSISLTAATQILMFNKKEETDEFVREFYPTWKIDGSSNIYPTGESVTKSEEIPSLRLISQSLSYATEMERIV